LLIVAIPKSASSSLVASVQEATGWAKSNAGIRKQHLTPLPAPEGYGQLKRFHSEVAELTPDVVELLKQPDQIVKLHIAPTANNLALLRDVPKVVLLRRPKKSSRLTGEGRKLRPGPPRLAKSPGARALNNGSKRHRGWGSPPNSTRSTMIGVLVQAMPLSLPMQS
jgi:hypothetical protein